MGENEATMILSPGQYRYELRRNGGVFAVELERFESGRICGVRRTLGGDNLHEVEAELDGNGLVRRVSVRYQRGPFARSARYEADGEALRGSVAALAGPTPVIAKLGRFREIDADLVLFKALIIAHLRARGQRRFTGRVAVIDPATLVASLLKQTYREADAAAGIWHYEPRLGDTEEISIDQRGSVLRRLGSSGVETLLVESTATATR